MVGVAQHSKGCGTCRRRKVKCDETQPACIRCRQARITCEGYQRWPVFIVRTQSGYRKRKPLEEIKVNAPLPDSLINSPFTEATCYISWFWETFGASSPTKAGGLSSSHWLYHFMYCQEPVFRRSLLAVSLTAFGMHFRRPEATNEGRKLYTLSLQSVREHMLLANSVEREEIPAAVCTMVLCELLNPTTESPTSWLAHLDGLCSLLSRRGPHKYCHSGSRAVLEHCRHLAFIRSLASRKASIFCLPIWLSQPWNGVVKDIPQLTIDYGLQLASIYEQCDFALSQYVEPESMVEILNMCIILYDDAQTLHNKQHPLDPILQSKIQPIPRSRSYTTRNIGEVMLSITILTVQLGACTSAYQLVNRLSSLPVHSTEVLSQGIQNAIKDASELVSMLDVLARQILAAIQTCPSECTGPLESVMIVYALNLASQCLTLSDQASLDCVELLRLYDARASRCRALLGSS